MSGEWRVGFLFLGNQLALDFLNSRPLIQGELRELLPDGGALARWLAAAGLLRPGETAKLARVWSEESYRREIEELHAFRERLRTTVARMESGSAPAARFIEELNDLLLRFPYPDQVVGSSAGWERTKRFAPRTPRDVLAPLADATADLLTLPLPSRVRQCPGCTLHFYDTSKKGTRQWCSMSMCGNRAKAAAYAARRRTERTGDQQAGSATRS